MKQIKWKRFIVVLLIPVTVLLMAFQSYFQVPMPKRFYEKALEYNPDDIDSLVKYRSYYPFIQYEKNYIEWFDTTAISSFFNKVGLTSKRKLKVLQIGDSHIQADVCSGYIRERLQEILGYGGRGLIFPYKIAATNSAYDYYSTFRGRWEYTKSVQRDNKFDMGMIGATVFTNDTNASFKFVFREGFVREDFNVLKIYCKQDTASFDIKVSTSSEKAPIYLDCNDVSSGKPYVEVQLSGSCDTVEIFVNKTDHQQSFFECYGAMIESSGNQGLLYNSSGINGAGYVSLLRQKLFATQLAELNPDLVIIDMGANDFYAGAFNHQVMKSNLNKIIDIIRVAAPNTNILLTNAQDIYYRRKYNVAGCADFAEMTKAVAKERNCAVYNYYAVSGGKYSMNKWFKYGLARPDKVHLSAAGYYIRGELLLNAILKSYALWLKQPELVLAADQHILDSVALKKHFSSEISFHKETSKTTAAFTEEVLETDPKKVIYYKIRSGDNLGSIAEKFGVKVSQIQYWNALSGTKIIAGETLVIYSTAKPTSHASPNPIVAKPIQTQSNPAITNRNRITAQRRNTYKVVMGDNLWSIARRFNTTVDKLKKANNLKTDKLSIGQTLLIP